MDNTDDLPQAAAAEQPEAPRRAAPEIDIQRLTERVYQLMLADLRLERARGEVIRRGRR